MKSLPLLVLAWTVGCGAAASVPEEEAHTRPETKPPSLAGPAVDQTMTGTRAEALAIDDAGKLYQVWLPSGKLALVGDTHLSLTDIAWDEATSTLFAVDAHTLYALDPSNAAPTTIAPITSSTPAAATGLVANAGKVYISFTDQLVGTIDTTTGQVQKIVSVGGDPAPFRTGDGDLEFLGDAVIATDLYNFGGDDGWATDATLRIDLAKDKIIQQEILGNIATVGFCINGLVTVAGSKGPILYGLSCDGLVLEIEQTLNLGSTIVGHSNVKFMGATRR